MTGVKSAKRRMRSTDASKEGVAVVAVTLDFLVLDGERLDDVHAGDVFGDEWRRCGRRLP